MTKRKCKKLISDAGNKRAIFIDSENENEILEYIRRSDKHKKKFAHTSKVILEGLRLPDLYDKENINDKCKDVTAMKFFKGGSNDRIYCKEMNTPEGCFVIIMAILHEKKKNQKNKAREISQIESVASYEYLPVIDTTK